jgi:UDP-N-acetylmuramoyl-tripeptide--D-alanyl-D-alanine ligase
MAIRRAGLVLLLVLGFCGATHAGDPLLSRAEIERRAEAAARYLVATETAEGRFFYEFDFLRSHFTPDDNIVRQAGAGFVLNQFYFASGKPGFAEPSARSIGYYEAESVAVGDGLLPSEDDTLTGGRAGGAALALLAELFHSRAIGRDFRPDLRQAWFRGLAAQQLPDGGIAQVPGETTADSYATGEAWLALAHYIDLVPDAPEVAAMLERLEAGVMAKYLATPDRMFAHWGMMAAAQRLTTTGDARYRDFLKLFAADYVAELMPSADSGTNTCAALEGVIAAAAALEQHGVAGVAATLRARIETDLPRNLELQLPGDSTRLEFGPGQYYEDPKLKTLAGAFRNGAYVLRTRVDSTQHCLSALLLYRQTIDGAGDWKM